MIIKRDDDLKDYTYLSFIYELDSEDLWSFVSSKLMIHEIVHSKYPPSQHSKFFRILIDIEVTHFDPYVIKSINEELYLSEDMFGFFLGITSAYHLGGFTVPLKVVEYISIVGGKVGLSYARSYEEKDYPPFNSLR